MEKQPQASKLDLLDRIVKSEDTDCWLWLTQWGTPSKEFPRVTQEECGSLISSKGSIAVVRVLYYLLREVGMRAPDKFPSTCGNPLCVNPHHRAATHHAKFWLKVDKEGKNGCWNWTGANTGKGVGYGHGRFSFKGKPMTATHYMLKHIMNIGIPKGRVVLHSCDNTACVNPEHLTVGTQSENIKDSYLRNRKKRTGVVVKLTEAAVNSIIKNKGTITVANLAKKYSVTEKTIYRVYSGATWSHITGIKND